jgi:NDMA-dependent alcohol dehydrogenase
MPKAAVCRAQNEPLSIEEIEVHAPKAGEVKVRMAASGVCHSDLSVQNGTLFGAYPIVLGHEGAGVVHEVGEGVEGLAVGDHVVVSWVPRCGTCFYCERGQGFLCEIGAAAMAGGGQLDGTSRFTKDGEDIRQMASTGTFSEHTVVPAIGAVRIPDDVPLDIAALIGCGVLTGVGAAVNTASIRPGDTVAVVGCGGVGLNVIQGAVIAGAARVIAVDMLESKLKLASQFGATDLVDASGGAAVADVLALTENRGADVAFEVIGLESTIMDTIQMTRRGGEAVLVGVPRMDVVLQLPAMFGVILMSKTIKGCWYGSANVHEDVPKLLGWYREGSLKLDELISRRIELDDVNDAFRAMEAGEVARTVIEYGEG